MIWFTVHFKMRNLRVSFLICDCMQIIKFAHYKLTLASVQWIM